MQAGLALVTSPKGGMARSQSLRQRDEAGILAGAVVEKPVQQIVTAAATDSGKGSSAGCRQRRNT